MLAVLTEWDEFKWVDLDKVADLMARPRVVDARNLLDRSALTRRGFTYQGIGPDLMARVVVTGGAGFLGSHLTRALLARGDEVVAVDNLSTGRPANIERPARATRRSPSSSTTSASPSTSPARSTR